MSVTVLTVAKAPVPGLAKTRLSPAFSPHEAASLAAAALLDTLDAVAATPGVERVVALTGAVSDAVASVPLSLMLAGFRVLPQRGDDFAERLFHAHLDAAGPWGAVLQIGMDTPQVTATLLSEAASLLESPAGPDAVLGRAEDGGWWALGLRQARHARLLTGVQMSSAGTGEQTLQALLGAGLSVQALPTLSDVDTLEDVARVAELSPDGRFGQLAWVLVAGRRPVADLDRASG